MFVEIDQTNFSAYIAHQDYSDDRCDHSSYFQWSKTSDTLKTSLIKVGEINLPATFEHNAYWGYNTPIVLEKYPYCQTHIERCDKSNRHFFQYREEGGHVTESRHRLIRPALMSLPVQEILINLALVGKNYPLLNYFLYELKLAQHSGKNWDALWDAVTKEAEMPDTLILYNWNMFMINNASDSAALQSLATNFNCLNLKKEIKIVNDGQIWC